jgi:hypothetical protein
MLAPLRDHLTCGQERGRSFPMKKLSHIAIAASLLMCAPSGALLAQNAPSNETPAANTPAQTPAPAEQPAATPPAASNPPAASTPPAATNTPAATTTEKDAGAKKKKSAKKMSRRQEIDRSIDSGTVPSRYRSQVPREYQKYVPFDR